eukprot:GILI01033790.1.p1 GENE.GILI01033790.1~~GILI01033790.1.p1  ORF type:complete len:300 (-),score=90.35 GILI01033790.1:81-905(-)
MPGAASLKLSALFIIALVCVQQASAVSSAVSFREHTLMKKFGHTAEGKSFLRTAEHAFSQMDNEKSGEVTLGQFMDFFVQGFKADGKNVKVTPAVKKAFEGKFNRIDLDGNGKLSLAEVRVSALEQMHKSEVPVQPAARTHSLLDYIDDRIKDNFPCDHNKSLDWTHGSSDEYKCCKRKQMFCFSNFWCQKSGCDGIYYGRQMDVCVKVGLHGYGIHPPHIDGKFYRITNSKSISIDCYNEECKRRVIKAWCGERPAGCKGIVWDWCESNQLMV